MTTSAANSKPMTSGSKLTSDEWCTPRWLTDLLGWFDLDPCSNARSSVQSGYRCAFDSEPSLGNGLEIEWQRGWSVFVNPPYSDVGPWAAKLAAHAGPWATLLKLDPTTKWWSTLMQAAPSVSPFKKRIKFEGDLPMTANFPSVLVHRGWSPSRELAEHLWIARLV